MVDIDESALMRMYWIKQIQKLPTREQCLSLCQAELEVIAHQNNVDFATISEGYICASKRSLGVKIGGFDEELRFKSILYWSLYGSITEEYFLRDESIWDLSDIETIEWRANFKKMIGNCHQISQLSLAQVLMYAKSDN